jgi:hypothetical protein
VRGPVREGESKIGKAYRRKAASLLALMGR